MTEAEFAVRAERRAKAIGVLHALQSGACATQLAGRYGVTKQRIHALAKRGQKYLDDEEGMAGSRVVPGTE